MKVKIEVITHRNGEGILTQFVLSDAVIGTWNTRIRYVFKDEFTFSLGLLGGRRNMSGPKKIWQTL
jgi:hypothetical protein